CWGWTTWGWCTATRAGRSGRPSTRVKRTGRSSGEGGPPEGPSATARGSPGAAGRAVAGRLGRARPGRGLRRLFAVLPARARRLLPLALGRLPRVVEVRQGDPRQALADLPLDGRQQLLLRRRNQHPGVALRLGPGGAADAVDVVVGVVG